MTSNQPTTGKQTGFRSKNAQWLFSAVAGILVIASVYNQIGGKVYAVEVGGEVLGYVREAEAVQAKVDELAQAAAEQAGQAVTVGDAFQIRAVPKKGITLCEPEEVCAELCDRLPLEVQGCLVQVNGSTILGVASPEEGEAVLAELKEDYIARYIKSPSAAVESVAILETVELTPAAVPLKTLQTKAEAKQYLATGTTETKEYRVAKGDSFWTIAKANGLSVDDLTAANPAVKPDSLKIGQTISMIVPKPYITIASHERVTTTESIGFAEEVINDSTAWAWSRTIQQRGVSGQKEVVYAITRQNGQVVDKQIVSQQVLKEPVRQIVKQGTKRDTSTLAVGTGSFMWPAVGRITSYYGTRSISRGSSNHTGIDIGVPAGTPVQAADDGVVTKAEYAGNYGRVVIINHGNGYSTLYAHNSVLKVKVGEKITRGQVIALAGSTGRSTGPHVHFEIRYNDKPQNPINFFK